MKYGSLFTGIGGLDLGVEMATGAEPAWLCESDPFCRAVLEERWPGVPVRDDVRLVKRTDASVDMIIGGFPCQDVSQAGKQEGLDGERSGLWREFARCIRELRPDVVFVENVAGLLIRGAGDVLGDLADLGFDAEWSCLRASDVGAPHLRRRVFILAARSGLSDAERDGIRVEWQRHRQQHDEPRPTGARIDGGRVANTDGARRQGAEPESPRGRARPSERGHELADPVHDGRPRQRGPERNGGSRQADARRHVAHRRHAWPPGPADADGWASWVRRGGAEPGLRRGALGAPRGVDANHRRRRIRHLGNAVVPQQAALAFELLAVRLFGKG